jgi:hypothetical protein
MKHSQESLSEHRKQLSEQISRQRTELAVAYRGLIKPFQYTETGITAVKALRKNGWMIALAPSVVSLVFTFFGWKKAEKPGLFSRLRRKGKFKDEDVEEKVAAKVKKPVSRWAGHAWSAFQVYRRVRPFLPFP